MFKFAQIKQLIAFYGVGVINTVFGYSLYSALVWVGLNLFLAQILSHCTGMAFNYFMYKRHVFKDSQRAIVRYVLAYAANYGMGVGFLALFHQFVANAYLSGFLAMLCASFINFAILKLLVFREKEREANPGEAVLASK